MALLSSVASLSKFPLVQKKRVRADAPESRKPGWKIDSILYGGQKGWDACVLVYGVAFGVELGMNQSNKEWLLVLGIWLSLMLTFFIARRG